jgi:hypothetical protein
VLSPGGGHLCPVKSIAQFAEKAIMDKSDIKDYREYSDLRCKIVSEIREHLKSIKDLDKNAERVMLFLDVLACPYVEQSVRESFLQKYVKQSGQQPLARNDLDAFFAMSKQQYWFVKWENVDLLNSLQKRELRKAY